MNKELMDRIEQVSDMLACAQDYDWQVLADLHRWFNHTFRKSCFKASLETAAISAASAKIVEGMLMQNFCTQCSMRTPAVDSTTKKERIKVQIVHDVQAALHGVHGQQKDKYADENATHMDEQHFSNQHFCTNVH